MQKEENYIIENRKLWNARVPIHVKSDFYNMPNFIAGESSLKPIELDLLGDVHGKSILHLQCHFGQDSLSLVRKGAELVGVDFSDVAINQARELTQQLGLNAKFVCCDIYKLREYIDEKFDIVFTTYGTIGWLPDLEKWAENIAYFLKPGGELIFVEFHPVVWMFDSDFKEIMYSYFNVGPIIQESTSTYTDNTSIEKNTEYGWNHSLAEVITALLNHGLIINIFKEFDHSPYNCFQHLISKGDNKFYIEHLDRKIPLIYALKAIKKN